MAFLNPRTCLTEPKQVLKLIVLIICICSTIYQLSACVDKMLNPPVSTYYKFYLNETIQYPSVTICRKPAYKTAVFAKYGLNPNQTNLKVQGIFKHFYFDKYTIQQFLTEASYSFNELCPSYGFERLAGSSSGVNIVSRHILNYGLCHTIIPQGPSRIFSRSGGYFFYLRHNVQRLYKDNELQAGFKIYVHDPNEILTSEEEQADSFLEYIDLDTGEDVSVILKVQKYSQTPTTNGQCVSQQNYSKSKCQEECIHDQVAQKVGCVLPWLRVTDKINLPICSDLEGVTGLLKGFQESNRSQLLKNCECKMSCNISVYTTQIVSRRDLTRNDSMINIYYPSNLVTVMEEVISYDWNLFLSDIGGSLGFLLGLSVIGMLALFEEIFLIALNLVLKRKKKKLLKSDNSDNISNNISERKNSNDAVHEHNSKKLMQYLSDYGYYDKSFLNDENNDKNKY